LIPRSNQDMIDSKSRQKEDKRYLQSVHVTVSAGTYLLDDNEVKPR
jgi:hypothetical protein